MAQLEPHAKEIGKVGSLVYVAAQSRHGLFRPERFFEQEQNSISYPFLLDEDRAVTRAYGVYHAVGLDAFNIAHPATFVVGHDGRVRWIYVSSNQTDRSPVEDLLREFRKVT